MKISRNNLNILIESFLHEEDSDEKSDEKSDNINYEGRFDIGSNTFEININSKTGVDVNVKSKDNATNDKKIDDKKEVSAIIAGILNSNKKEKKSMQSLVNAYKNVEADVSFNNSNYRTHLVNFISKYNIS
tara:strand:+ start:184 stop:576 length:393 start_codon:yes stop_codon:yes gene_type:complete